jgi:hypothetical protein
MPSPSKPTLPLPIVQIVIRTIKFFVVLLILCDLEEHLDRLLDEVLLDDLENLVLLQRLARDVEGKILRVHHALHEREVLEEERAGDRDNSTEKKDVSTEQREKGEKERKKTSTRELVSAQEVKGDLYPLWLYSWIKAT